LALEYCFQDLKAAIDEKRPKLANRKGVVFHQNYVYKSEATETSANLSKKEIEFHEISMKMR